MHPTPTKREHGPANAEHELRKAYNSVMECQAALGNSPRSENSHLLEKWYRHAFRAYREDNRLAAERWARATKHLARALWHELKLDHALRHAHSLPFLTGSTADEYNLHDHSDTVADLIESVIRHVPRAGVFSDDLARFVNRAKEHLSALDNPSRDSNEQHEMVRFEHINCAHEYGRVLECLTLALEAESKSRRAA